MILISASLKNGTAVVVGILLVILSGYLAFTRIPIQLNPTIDSPFITVETLYPGASALEVEQEITNRLEEKLAAVENLREMRSSSREGVSEVVLKFDWGINKDLAQLDVLQKINLAEELPEDAEEPQILTVNRREQSTVMWLFLKTDSLDVNQLRRLADDVIIPQIERVPDVETVRRFGGAEREIHVLVDLAAIAARDLALNDVARALARENRNVRGGNIDRGPSRLVVRTLGQYDNLEQIRETVVTNGPNGPVRIRDIGEVRDANEDLEVYVRVNGQPTISLGVVQRIGSNTLKIAEDVKKLLERMNESLASRGVEIKVSYDSSVYIWGAIDQLIRNLLVGAALATMILWFFLRSMTSTLIVGLTIPICMMATFVCLIVFGRSVNVVSLAGLAFAGGMIVDNGIVVVENIYRHRTELGKSILIAARDGAREVWAPIVASTLTTLAVFIPVLFIQERAGQLFRDMAYAIVFAVGLSAIAAITMVPMLCSRWLSRLPARVFVGQGGKGGTEAEEDIRRGGFPPAVWLHKLIDPVLGAFGGAVGGLFLGVVRLGVRRLSFALAVIALVTLGFFWSLRLIPPAEYLPRGNENFILGMIKLPAGMSPEGSEELLTKMERKVLDIPELDRTFFVMLRDMPIFGVILQREAASKQRIQEIVADLNGYARSIYPFPDMIPILFQIPVFGRGQGSGKTVTLDLSGPDLRKLQELTNRCADRLRRLPGVLSVRPTLDLDNPELQVIPDRERLADLGMRASDVAETVETLVEGLTTSLYRDAGKEYDLVLKALDEQIRAPEDLASVMLSTPSGEKVRLVDVARVERRLGPVVVEHVEQERSSSIEITPLENFPLEQLVDEVKSEVVDPMLAELPLEYQIFLSGTADDLVRTLEALSFSFVLALIIIYLLMAALFRSFFYPFIIMFSVPLSMTGALLAISWTGAEFNVITMLGFILLAGVVVNNAILLVDVTLEQVRQGVSHGEAVIESVRRRIRPIFMTSITSVLGMLPLASGQGAGADLYNGLGVAVIGGLTLSTLFTLVLIPILLKVFMQLRDNLAVWIGRAELTEAGTARRLAELDAQM